MTKPTVNQLGAVGLMLDGDPTMLPDQAITDCLNVRFNGREIESYQGNYLENYYTQFSTGETDNYNPLWLIQPVIFDGFSEGARLLFGMKLQKGDPAAEPPTTDRIGITQQNMSTPSYNEIAVAQDISTWVVSGTPWNVYKGQINNCAYFGLESETPIGKAYDWTGFDYLPGWGEQTTGNDGTTSTIVERRWSCKKLVAFDNRLIMMNTTEESSAGTDVPYPNRLRWSGFAQENAFPINWDDTAANRTAADYAAAVIDGYAGWQDLTTSTQIIDACENGGTLYVYTERETFALTPTGNDQSPFLAKTIYSDLGCLDMGCVVNCHGYNYVFSGSDVVRHDSVSWKSIADGYVRDYIAEIANDSNMGKVRLIGYPELSEIWVMIPGTQNASGDYGKSTALTYNYIKGTWSKKTLPYIYDAVFVPVAPDSSMLPVLWDNDTLTWDANTAPWSVPTQKTSQGTMVGTCAAGGVYVLNSGKTESRWTASAGVYSMVTQDLQCFIERRGLDFSTGQRSTVTATYLNGLGTNTVTMKIGYAHNPDSGYKWDTQTIDLTSHRRSTWRCQGESHGYRLEIAGQGSIPVGINFTVKSAGKAG